MLHATGGQLQLYLPGSNDDKNFETIGLILGHSLDVNCHRKLINPLALNLRQQKLRNLHPNLTFTY